MGYGKSRPVFFFDGNYLPTDDIQSFIPADPFPLAREPFALTHGIFDPVRAVNFMDLIHNLWAELATGITLGRITLNGYQSAIAGRADDTAGIVTIPGTNMVI